MWSNLSFKHQMFNDGLHFGILDLGFSSSGKIRSFYCLIYLMLLTSLTILLPYLPFPPVFPFFFSSSSSYEFLQILLDHHSPQTRDTQQLSQGQKTATLHPSYNHTPFPFKTEQLAPDRHATVPKGGVRRRMTEAPLAAGYTGQTKRAAQYRGSSGIFSTCSCCCTRLGSGRVKPTGEKALRVSLLLLLSHARHCRHPKWRFSKANYTW